MKKDRKLIVILVTLSVAFLAISVNFSFAEENIIPIWIKNTASFWVNDKVSDTEFINALEFLISNNIIQLPTQNESVEDKGSFYVTYDPNPNSFEEYSAKDWIEDTEYFEINIKYLNETFRLPHDVEVLLTECNEPNAFYDYELKQIIICYEFIDSTYAEFSAYYEVELRAGDLVNDNIGVMTRDVVDFIFYHELGHALVDIHNLPITGLEENAVDQFSTLFMLLAEGEQSYEGIAGQDILYNVGTWFLIQTELVEQSYYWDEHNLDIQRFYNISCYAYGQNPEYNQDLIDVGDLPKERAENCPYEYWLMKSSWDAILSKYYK